LIKRNVIHIGMNSTDTRDGLCATLPSALVHGCKYSSALFVERLQLRNQAFDLIDSSVGISPQQRVWPRLIYAFWRVRVALDVECGILHRVEVVEKFNTWVHHAAPLLLMKLLTHASTSAGIHLAERPNLTGFGAP
jgi:hypothetical protein